MLLDYLDLLTMDDATPKKQAKLSYFFGAGDRRVKSLKETAMDELLTMEK